MLHIVGLPSWHPALVHCHTVQSSPSRQHESAHNFGVSAATGRSPRHFWRCGNQSHSGTGSSGGGDGAAKLSFLRSSGGDGGGGAWAGE